MERNYQLLKDVLSVPTKTYKEDRMIEFLVNWLTENQIPFQVDEHRNIYATKSSQDITEDFYFPCVIAHTDTVHQLDVINVREMDLPNAQGVIKPSLKAFNDLGQPTGIGGDDKCGVYACLELLKELPNLKAAFFVSEETGCHGSKKADENFFSNVGYTIQFDGPENYMITEVCHGVRLFDRESEFFNVIDSVFKEKMEYHEYKIHPYTDVAMLKMKFDFSCVNISIGYYNYHTPHEYVVLDDVERGIDVCKTIIERLGNTKQEYVYEPPQKVYRPWVY